MDARAGEGGCAYAARAGGGAGWHVQLSCMDRNSEAGRLQAGNNLDRVGRDWRDGCKSHAPPWTTPPEARGRDREGWLIVSELPCYNVMLIMSGGAEPSPPSQKETGCIGF